MWRILTAALKWYVGEYQDDAEAKVAIFAAIAEARATHLTRVAPLPC
jgi:hypothetical protein